MRTRLLTGIIILLILAACTPATAEATATPLPSATPPSATEAVLPSPAAPTETAMEATAPSASSALQGVVVFKIVPQETTASYTVGETFFSQNNRFATAIGTTGQISGEITADLSNPPASTIGPIEIDVSQLVSDSNRRDSYIRQNALESSRFPTVTFTSTQVEGLPDSYVEGQEYSFKVTGDLAVHQVTQSVTFDVTARLNGDTLSGTATSSVLMSDFGIGPISLVGMLQTEDEVKLTLNFVARP